MSTGTPEPKKRTTLAALNGMTKPAFVAALTDILERTSWVMDMLSDVVAGGRPYASMSALHDALMDAVRQAPAERRLALLRAHPELGAGGARPRDLDAASAAEQASLGLDRLDDRELARFDDANRAYRDRFGFPFIVAVKGQRDRAAILALLDRRMANDVATEIETALDEVAKIARFRLEALLAAATLSTHVLDTSTGKPAAELQFALFRLTAEARALVWQGATGADGRASCPEDRPLEAGVYELVFEAGRYQRAQPEPPFYDQIPVRFTIADPQAHYHVPLVFARYGYSTYRGS